MSLDLYLHRPTIVTCPCCKTKFDLNETDEFSSGELSHYDIMEESHDLRMNITHNLTKMASAVSDDFYRAIWRPEELFVIPTTTYVLPLLEEGLSELKSNRHKYEKFNSPNGWGLYEHFVPWVEEYIEKCRKNPDCRITASR